MRSHAAPHESADDAAQPLDRARLWGLVATNLGASVAFAAMYSTQPVLPQIAHEFSVGAATAGLTLLSVTFGVALASLGAGNLTDRFGSRRVMLVCSAALSALCFAVAAAPNLGLLIGLRAVQGLVIPGITVAGLAYLHNELPASWRGRVSGFYISANTLGGLAGRLGVGATVESLGWRGGLLMVAGVATMGTFILLIGMPRKPSYPQDTGTEARRLAQEAHVPLGAVARRLWWAPLIGGTVFFPFLSTFTYMPYRLESPPFNLPASLTSLSYLVYLLGAVAAPLAGNISDRIGRRTTIYVSFAVAALGLGLSLVNVLPVALLALALVCAGSLAAHVVANASVSDTANPLGPQARGTALSLYTLGFYIGGGLGSFIPGIGWEHWGWPGVLAPCLAALAGAALCALKTPLRPRGTPELAPALDVP